ncbi:hypothetical protein HK100_009980, partial [Physocladia obscura]
MKRSLATSASSVAIPATAFSAVAFQVLVRKKQSFSKKHKSWDDDAILAINTQGLATLFSMEGKEIGKNPKFALSSDPYDETVYNFAGKEVQ